jgi:PRTRC genetic system protein B
MTAEVLVRTGGTARYELHAAILLYASRTGIGGHAGDVYATVHEIERNRPGGPRLAPGQPATVEACSAFARSMTDRAAFSGWIAPDILFIGPRTVAWWRAPAPATMFFETDHKDPQKALGTRQGVLPQPGLVHVLAEGRWSVYAVKGAKRPGPSTPLFHAPYFNVYADGNLCEGNIRRPARVNPDTLAEFERAFFHSRFTHPNAESRQLTRYPRGVYALWRDLLDGRHKAFPEKSLLPQGKHTLESLLRSLERDKAK